MNDDLPAPGRRVFVAAVLLGLGFDTMLHHRPASASTALVAVFASVTLIGSGVLKSRFSHHIAAAAPLFAGWAMIRASPWLVPLDLMVALALLVLAVSASNTDRCPRYGIRDLAWLAPRLAAHGAATPAWLLKALPDLSRERRSPIAGVVSGLALAGPLVVVLTALLATGDAAFATLLGSLASVQHAPDHVAAVTAGSAAGLVVLRAALASDPVPRPEGARPASAVEALTVLAAIAVVYAAFALAQIVDSVTGAAHILGDPHRTMEWVHTGFFRLLWAAGITLGALLVLDHLVSFDTPRHRRWYRSLVSLVVGLTLVAVWVAMYRIGQYCHTFGFTMLRIGAWAFAGWIGVVFLLYLVRTAGVGRDDRWFPAASLGAGLAVLLALNIANPETIIVANDLGRADDIGVEHLLDLSDDAVPALVEGLDRLREDTRRSLLLELCRRDVADVDGLNWNRSHAAARAALGERCAP